MESDWVTSVPPCTNHCGPSNAMHWLAQLWATCSPSQLEWERSPTLAWTESSKEAHLQMTKQGRMGGGVDAGNANINMHTSVFRFFPCPSRLLFSGRKLPVSMSCWGEGMLIVLTGEFCTQKGHLHSAQYNWWSINYLILRVRASLSGFSQIVMSHYQPRP